MSFRFLHIPGLALLVLCGNAAAAPRITEFMADNTAVLADQDGAFSDWIEIHNPDPLPVSLENYALTDDAALLTKWRFPAVTLAANGRLKVFASGKNRAVAGSELHTNFQLSSEGEFLALIAPDGATVVQQFNPFPPQKENISYGQPESLAQVNYLTTPGSLLVPGSPAALPADWNAKDYAPGAAWTAISAPPGIGYDTGVAPPAPSNIAATGTAVQSTTNGVYAANLGANGIATDFTHTLSTDTSAFWQLNFAAAVRVDRVVLRNRGDGCCGSRLRDITVELLDAGNAVLYTSALLNPENTGYVYPGGPASLEANVVTDLGAAMTGVRGVRVRRTADGDLSGSGGLGTDDERNVLSLGEVEVIGIGAGTSGEVNLARTGSPVPTAVQTSTLSAAWAASNGINGVLTDGTHTLNTDATPAWTVNLGRKALINSVKINNRGDGCCAYRLRDITITILDADGTTVLYTSALLNPENSLAGPALLTLDLSGTPVLGQYVRVRRTPDLDFSGQGGSGTADDASVLSMGEVTVTGTDVSGLRAFIRNDVQTAMSGVNASAFLRLPFTVSDPAAVRSLSLRIRYDDGFVAWLNGVKVAERNAPASPAWNSAATANRTLADVFTQTVIDLSPFLGSLSGGSNVLAIQGLNSAAGDAEFLIQPELQASVLEAGSPLAYLETPTPGAVNNTAWFLGDVADTSFSHNRGFYETAFNLEITSPTPGAKIYYTVNNSDPTPANGALYTAPFAVSGTRVIRARAYLDKYKPTNIDTHTYIFPADVTNPVKVSLSTAGGVSGSAANIPAGWPTNAATNGGQAFIWGFDAAVKALYTPAQMKESLTQIPVVSLVTQQNNLTDPSTGIYVNGVQHGDAWERPASVEMLDFSKPGVTLEAGHSEFAENCGIRIRGGASRGDSSTKHSFRVFFRKGYGNGKLSYRLYGANGAAEYENFDLRGSQNYSWSQSATDVNETMVRDPFCRETLGAMGQPYTRSRYCHLFLNGLYWGIYDIHERAENSFGETYLGGKKEDYDSVKCGDRYTLDFKTEATDGYLSTNPDGSKAAWKDLWDRAFLLRTQPTSANYFRLLGRNPDGTRNSAWPVLVDIDNLIDYMLVIFYTGDGDATLSSFLSNNKPNNWFSLRDRKGTRGFTFYCQDGEHTLLAPNWGVDRTGPYLANSNSTVFDWSNPQWVHDELALNAEYKIRFADHVRKHFFNGGPLSAAVAKQRWLNKAAGINKAIRLYAARYSNTSTGENAWNTRINFIRDNFFDSRPAAVLNQLRTDGLWPLLAPSDFSQFGGNVPSGYQLTMTVPAGATVYYTLDGSDPRIAGAGSPTPFTYATKNATVLYHVPTAASGLDNGFTSTPVTPPNPGPLSRYALDGNANDTGTPGGNNGTPMNNPVYTADRNGVANGALSLNGTSQSVNLNNPADLQITGQISFAAWIRPTATDGIRNILNKGHALSPSGEITLRINAGGIDAGTWNGTTFSASAAGAATLNTWQHICGVFDGGAWRLYKDGAQIASFATAQGAVAVAGSTPVNNYWSIGSRGGGAERFFAGQIDDVQIFNRGLTPEEVLALYSANGSIITAAWKEPGFGLPASWSIGHGGLGYDADAGVDFSPFFSTNVQSSMQGKSPSLIVRKDFTLTDSQVTNTAYLQLNVRYDDGFIAYLNGTKVAERNAPASNVNGLSAATGVRTDADAIIQEKIDITSYKSSLSAGSNLLAIHGLNTTAADSDFLLESELVAADSAALSGAALSPGAVAYSGPVTLTTPGTVNARVYQNGAWSALTSAYFAVALENAATSNLNITEIHYNPAEPVAAAELLVSSDRDDYEFIEIANVSGSSGVDLNGVRFTAGITTADPGHVILQPGERGVLVKSMAAFNARYGSRVPAPRILGTYVGNLANSGEQIILSGPAGDLRAVTYDDSAPWPTDADGDGMSLTLIRPSPSTDHTLPQNWRGSAASGGTPGSTDATGYAQWKAVNGQPADTSDTDGDGISAVMEYTLGTPPAVAGGLPMTAQVTVDGYLTMSLRHSATADDTEVRAETSTLLSGWTTAGLSRIGDVNHGDGTVTTSWRTEQPVSASPVRFVRAVVSLR